MSSLSHAYAADHPQDPWEKFNRAMYRFNKQIDTVIIKPVAYVYWRYCPDPLQSSVGNFFDNLKELPNIANDIFQFKFAYATKDTSRFLINSTLGVLGFFDPATSLGLDRRRGDFGQTLYQWGYKESVYLILPLLGPSTVRDAIGLAVDYTVLSVWPWVEPHWRYPLLVLDAIDIRTRALRRESVFEMLAVDEYVFVRDAYFQRRQFLFNQESDETNEVDPYKNALPTSEEKAERTS